MCRVRAYFRVDVVYVYKVRVDVVYVYKVRVDVVYVYKVEYKLNEMQK